MLPDRWQQVKAVFYEALELEGEARSAFLEEVKKRDPALWQEVITLLEADARTAGFLDRPPMFSQPVRRPPDRRPPDLLPCQSGENPASMVGRQIGAYRIERELGSGGMGQVYLASRTGDFQQKVAIKLLRKELGTEELIYRFHLERQILADLRHPNIARLYDGGTTEDGRPYLVMEYVAGEPFDAYCRKQGLSIGQRLSLFRVVCSAVHFAHQNRIAHLDLKPANVLVTPQGEPILLDFGIARILDSESTQKTRSLLRPMTLGFASPEQIRDEPITTATDIYALGAFLYQLIGGRPDALLGSRSIVFDPSVPKDIAVITRKCLEPDQKDRYDSAGGLAVDLELFLGNAPITARSHEMLYVLGRKMKQHRTAAALTAVTLIVLAALLIWSLRERMIAEERVRLARMFEQKAERIEAAVRHVHMLPIHDTGPDWARLTEEMNSIRELAEATGPRTEDLGHYALGRGYLVLGQLENALEHLTRAWEGGTREPRVALALGSALGALFQKKTREAERIRNPKERQVSMEAIESRYLVPALSLFQSYRQAGGEGAAYSWALLAFYEKDYHLALTQTRQAYTQAPWMYEARALEGDIFLAWANGKRNRGDFEAAMEDYRAAEQAYEAAAAVGPSLVSAYAALGDLGQAIMQGLIYGPGGDPMPFFELGMRGCRRLLTVEPESCEAFRLQSALYKRLSEYESAQGLDPRPNLDEAVRTASRALALCPGDAESLKQLGAAHYELGRFYARRGEDPTPFYEKANAAYDRAIDTEPDYQSHNKQGLMYRALALHELARGREPRDFWDRGTAAFEEAILINPEMVGAPSNLGLLLYDRAEFLMERGGDPGPFLDRSIQSLKQALTLSPEHAGVTYNLARSLLALAQQQVSLGLEPTQHLVEALDAFQHVVQLRPDVSVFFSGLGDALMLGAHLAWSRGDDPDLALKSALDAYHNALLLNPQEVRGISNTGEALLWLATYRHGRGHDPSALLQQALTEFSLALSLNPNQAEALRGLARAHSLHARSLLAQNNNPVETLSHTLETLDDAICLNDKDYLAHLIQAKALLLRARWEIHEGKNPLPWFTNAKESLDTALVLNPKDPETRIAVARWCRWMAHWQARSASHTEILPYLQEGHSALEAITASMPRNGEALALSGLLYLQQAEAARNSADRKKAAGEALAFLEKGLLENNNLAHEVGPYRVRAAELLKDGN